MHSRAVRRGILWSLNPSPCHLGDKVPLSFRIHFLLSEVLARQHLLCPLPLTRRLMLVHLHLKLTKTRQTSASRASSFSLAVWHFLGSGFCSCCIFACAGMNQIALWACDDGFAVLP